MKTSIIDMYCKVVYNHLIKMQKDANFFIIFIPENICLSNEEIWRYYILLFGDIGGVGTMEYGKYVASGEECDHV